VQVGAASCAVVHAVGEADVTTLALQEVLSAELAKRPQLLLVETSGLTFIDSSALHVIISAHSELCSAGSVLALISPSAYVARLLQLTGVDQVIPVYADAEEAIVSNAGRKVPKDTPRARCSLVRRAIPVRRWGLQSKSAPQR
jgi:anti-anti-sigma factor